MKDSRKYAAEIQKFYRTLKRKHSKVKKVTYDDLVESLVHAAVLEHLSDSACRTAFKKFHDHFVDFNDMRVSRAEEIAEMLGTNNETTRAAGANVLRILAGIFRRYNNINLEPLRKVGKRQSRTILEKIDGVSTFCVDYCMLTALQGHAIPLTPNMLQYLKDNGLIHPESDPADIEGFLTRQISAANAYEFYSLLRRETEKSGGAEEAKAKTKTKTKTKTKKSKKKK